MITGELKNKIDALWDIFASGGLVNPLEVIEQITYLMFIKELDNKDNDKAKFSAMIGEEHESLFTGKVNIQGREIDGKQLKWSVFKDFPAEKVYNIMSQFVFPFIKNLDANKESAYSKYMGDAIFKIPTPLMLSRVVDSLDNIFKLMDEQKADNRDVKGDVYEYLLDKISTAGRNGQFRTPSHIIRMMVELVDVKPGDTICDPACGSRVIIMITADSNNGDWLSSPLLENKNMDWCAF